MLIGYARVSAADQNTRGQVERLQLAGAEKIHEEQASGGRADRPALQLALSSLQPGDVLLVTKLDRLSRSLADLLQILDRINKAGAGFRSLTEAIDTTTPAGRMLMQMLGSIAEFERELIRERTRAGLEHARRHGRRGGRPRALTPAQEIHAAKLVIEDGQAQAAVARLLRVDPATIGRAIKRYRAVNAAA